MKFKKTIILTSLLFCLLTVGCVNATDYTNNTTSNDITSDTVTHNYDNLDNVEKSIIKQNSINNENIETNYLSKESDGNDDNQKSNTPFLQIIDDEHTHLTAEVIPDYLVISLKDDSGNPVSTASVEVNLTISNKYLTNSYGQILISLKNMEPGIYSAQISYAGNKSFIGDYIEVDVNVGSVSTEYQITIVDVVSKRNVTNVFNARVFSATNQTVDSGRVCFQLTVRL